MLCIVVSYCMSFILQEIARHLRPRTLRALFGQDKVKNAVHCTDLPEDGQLEVRLYFIIPHVNFPYKTSIKEPLIFYTITHCFHDDKYGHSFAIAVGDSLKYQYGHIMRNVYVHTVGSRQETFNSNGGHEA